MDFLKEWQASRLADLSRNYANEGKWNEAAMSASTALRLDPAQPEAARFMAGLMESEGRWEQAMELYGRIARGGGGTLADLKKQAISAARGHYSDPARFLADQVARKGEPEFPLLLEAEILLGKGEVEGARALLRGALDRHGSRTAQAAMLRFLLLHPGQGVGDLRDAVMALREGDASSSRSRRWLSGWLADWRRRTGARSLFKKSAPIRCGPKDTCFSPTPPSWLSIPPPSRVWWPVWRTG